MKSKASPTLPLLHTLEKDQLVRMVEELQEEKRMRDTFSLQQNAPRTNQLARGALCS